MILMLFLVSISSLTLSSQKVATWGGTYIYIRADGSVDPPDAPIQRDGDTYTFTADIYNPVVVERDNVVIDGDGYTLQGPGGGYYDPNGVRLSGRTNVTVQNTQIDRFVCGIEISGSFNNSISGNSITENLRGIWIDYSSNNSVGGNNMRGNYRSICFLRSSNNSVGGNNITANKDYGVWLDSSSNNNVGGNNIANNYAGFGISLDSSSNYNSVSGNNIVNTYCGIYVYLSSNNSVGGNNIANSGYGIHPNSGIWLGLSSNNSISGNNITANNGDGINLSGSSNNSIAENSIKNNDGYGIGLQSSSDNRIYHNNFIDNAQQVYVGEPFYPNVWDGGYPSGGNYWSDYTGTDSDHDGIGDTPYIIDANNADHYPLTGMSSSFSTSLNHAVNMISNSSISDFSFSIVNPSQAILSFNVTGDNETQGFCRICIPKALIISPYVVKLNGMVITEPQVRELSCSNEAYEYLYINYTHSEHTIEISGTTPIPEFPSFLILPLFFMATLLAAIVCRKKHAKISLTP
jgi:parallel beta-helix repeat protein